jgi:tetratricopeptide (TPR) repeat protein
MLPRHLGPYRLEKEIGSGGMGTVWLARAEDDSGPVEPGRPVALKILHRHLLGRPGIAERFAREAEVGRQVRHENVVRVLHADAVRFDGTPAHFLVMEYVAGRTLRRLLEVLGTLPEALLREIARQIASGLEAIHGAGIIHRDLKPENVLVTDDHRVRIMDLGVARLVEEEATLTREGEFAGSLYYAAPEQYRGGEVGPAADLYSLGVLLHELATGENPFRRDSVSGIVAAHLHEVPPPVLERNPDVSPFFSEVVGALLRKKVDRRLGSATELRDLLERGERARWWWERSRRRSRRGRGVPRVPVSRETRLHGRDHELAMLGEAWARARRGEGGVVLLEGESGIGKSRLVDAFLGTVPAGQAHVLYGSYPPCGGLGAISDAILGHFGRGRLEEAIRPHLAAAPALVPAFAALTKHESPPPGSEPARMDAMHAALCHLMRSLAAERPVVWVIEDLHFAREDSRKLVLSLARAAAGQRAFLIVTARPEGLAAERAALSGLAGARCTVLRRLGARQVIELLRDAFRSETLAEKLGGKIAYKSDGVPYFVLELLRGLRDAELIRQRPDGSWTATGAIERLDVPSAVRDLIGVRLRELSDRDRALLDTAAVQGFEIDPDLLARMRGLKRVDVLERLAACARRTGIVRGEEDRFRFDHHQVQEVLYSDLHATLRAEYHTALARAIEARADGGGEAASLLVHHHLLGTDPRAALPHLDASLEHLATSHRNDQALDLARRALARPGLLRETERTGVLLRMAERLSLLGRRDEEREVLEQALETARHDGSSVERARVLVALGYLEFRTARYAEADRRLSEALRLARAAGDPAREGEASRGLGAVRWALGDRDAARVHRERALGLARETGDRRAEAKATGNLGNLEFYLDRYAEARVLFERELAIAREIGDRRDEGFALGSLGMIGATTGDLSRAKELLENSLAIAREIGDRQGEAAAGGNLASVLLKLGESEAALRLRERQLAIAREIGERHYESIALSAVGAILVRLGVPRLARARFEAARRIADAIGARRTRADAESGSASSRRPRGIATGPAGAGVVR